MGVTHVTVSIHSLAKRLKPYRSEFLVDTGAIDCMAPASALRKAGVRPEKRKVYELADGSKLDYDVGFARVTFMGEETVAQVIFGPEGVEPILGVVALENTGIGVNPATQSLFRMNAIPLKYRR